MLINKIVAVIVGILFSSFVFLYIFGNNHPTLISAIGFFLLFSLILILVINFKVGVLFYLFSRNLLDYFKDIPYFVSNNDYNLATWVTICFIFFSIANIIKDKIAICKIKEFRPFAIFLFAIIPSVIFSFNKSVSLADWLRFFGLFMLFVAIYVYFCKFSDLKNIIIVIMFSLIIPLIVSTEQLLGGTRIFDSGFLRIFGTYIHPNMFAFYLVTVGMLALSLILSDEFVVNKNVGLILLLVISILLILTYTRSAWIGFCFGALILLGFKKRKAVPIVLILMLAILFIPSIQQRFYDVSDSSFHAGYEMGSWQWRLMFWKKTVSLAYGNSVYGIGLGVFPTLNYFYAHNDYLRMFVEAGVLGLLAYTFLLLSIVIRSLKIIKISRDPKIICISLAVLAIGCAYLMISFSDNLSRSTAVLVYYFALVAINDRLFLEEQKENSRG
jgi:O-antigen ligase